MDRWKSRGGKSQRREEKRREEKRREEERREAKRSEEKRSEEKRREEKTREERKSQKKEDSGARKGRKVVIHCDFPMICGSGGSKSRLAKAAGAEPCGHIRDEKLHAVVARSTFPSQNVQNTPGSEHFWKLSCWKSARRCGAQHISKSKCRKHLALEGHGKGGEERGQEPHCFPGCQIWWQKPSEYQGILCWTSKNQLPGKPSRHKKTWHWKKSPGNSACAWKLQISFLEHLKPWLNSLNIFTLA